MPSRYNNPSMRKLVVLQITSYGVSCFIYIIYCHILTHTLTVKVHFTI